jgi:hypothetical protein
MTDCVNGGVGGVSRAGRNATQSAPWILCALRGTFCGCGAAIQSQT